MREVEPPATVGEDDVIVLQPYGSLFFAAAPVFEELLPDVDERSRHSVVILRLRGRTDLGSTFMDVLRRYAESLNAASSKLVIISADEKIHQQLAATRVTGVVGTDNIYTSDQWIGATLKVAHDDAAGWIDDQAGSQPEDAG
jgi:SulP family sulfate permease